MRLLHIIYIFVLSLCCLPSAATISFRLMKGFPHDEAGIEKGVSACYAGRIGSTLIMAGGCNFPDKPVAEGGAKRYYHGIYAARISKRDTLRWQKVGDLPAEAAYGVSVSTDDAVVCVGGNNAHKSLTTVIKIRLAGGKSAIDTLPSLPCPMDNFTGALDGSCLLVRGSGRRVYPRHEEPRIGLEAPMGSHGDLNATRQRCLLRPVLCLGRIHAEASRQAGNTESGWHRVRSHPLPCCRAGG